MNKLILFITSFAALLTVNSQHIQINEIMASNSQTIQDQDGDYSDWIELYNPSSNVVNLNNYSISDDASNLNKWIFPNISIQPNEYLLIFTSDKNRLSLNELHTNFKISASGEALFLSDNFGNIIDQTTAIALSSDDSYGRIPDGGSNWTIINTPSPNGTNDNSNSLSFSHNEGFYNSTFSLAINSITTDTVFYTLNGDVPTVNSAFYTHPISIENRSSEPNVLTEIPTTPTQDLISYKSWESPSVLIDKATILRCATFKNGQRTSKVYSKTFFVDVNSADKYSIPVISLITENNNLFNADTGIYVPGIHFNSGNPEWTGNSFMSGDNWERDVHIEYFERDGNLGFSQDAGIRIHGGKTRQASQKSLRLYARNEYGEKNFNYKLFLNKENESYKRFILRTTMGAWGGQTIIKDVLAQNIASTLDLDYQEFQPVIVFLNGEYWGIHTIRDRIDERYIEYSHNVDKDLVEFNEPGNTHYENLLDFIRNNSLEIDENYDYVSTQIEIDNYIDYTIAEMFFANYDWPVNNIKSWRELPNGKWRWILYDLDGGLGPHEYNMFEHNTKNDPSVTFPNPPKSTFLFRNLLKNRVFKTNFINRYAEVLNTTFDIDVMKSKLDSIKGIYSPEMESHIERWNFPDNFKRWNEDIENELMTFIENRSCTVRKNLMSFFELENFPFYCFNNITQNQTEDLLLAPNPNTGSFFIRNINNDIVDATITISNSQGQIVYEENNVNLKKNKIKPFEIYGLTQNVYFLHIISNDYAETKKVVIY